jgi:serine/threonine-protein kinase
MTQENLAGRFTILRELGRGAIGAVYAARDASTGLVVALKILDPALFSESGAKLAELFLKNARAAARLRHRNIARVFDAGEAGGTAFVAMELVEGESLRRLLDQRPLSIARAIQIFDDIASALAYAHEEGMVHRGVKPSNIIVLPAGMAKIGDFGLGQIGEAALRYMSPEQARGEPLDHRSDLFSLGAVFYEMLTRRAPFEGDSPQQIRQSIVQAQPPLPSKVNPHVPGALDAMVSRLLAARPDERFADARVLLRDLQRVEEEIGLGPGAGAAASEPKPSVPPRAIEPTLRTAVAAPARVRDPAPILADEPLPERHAPFLKDPEPRPEPSSGSGATFLAALALMFAVLSIGLTVVLYYSPDLIERLILASGLREAPTPATAPAPSPSTAAAPSPSPVQQPVSEAIKQPATEPVPAPAPSPSPAPAPAPVAEAIKQPVAAPEPAPAPAPRAVPPPPVASAPIPKPLVEEPPLAEDEKVLARESEQPAKGDAAPTKQAPRAPQPKAKVRPPQPVVMAKLVLAVAPQGELYINGEHYGTTPPLTALELEPGMHRIEIRSGSRKPYLTYMTVDPGEERRIRHDFNAKSSRPPR